MGESQIGDTEGKLRDYAEEVGMDSVSDESIQMIEETEMSPDPIIVRIPL